MSNVKVNCGKIEISNDNKICIIAGPCQLETEQHAMDMAGKIQEITKKFGLGLIYKTSFDKANRTSLSGIRGIGLHDSLKIFSDLRSEYGINILTDVHNAIDCDLIKNHVDVLQIPAFLCRQTDLLIAAAKTNKIVNIKKGQFMSAESMKYAVDKVKQSGNSNIMLTERGTQFGYNDLIVDFRGISELKKLAPTILDVTHSVQRPNQISGVTGGNPEYIESLARAGIVNNIDGIFLETHTDPSQAKSDGANMLDINNLEELLKNLLTLREASSKI